MNWLKKLEKSSRAVLYLNEFFEVYVSKNDYTKEIYVELLIRFEGGEVEPFLGEALNFNASDKDIDESVGRLKSKAFKGV